jgi:hypothetical protein
MWHHVTNHLIISNDKDSDSETNEDYASVTKTKDPHPGLLIIAILSPSFPWLLISTSHLLPFIHLISYLISPLLFIYYLSILVEVLLRLLTYRGDLLLLYLVSKDHS